jgi:hypothetical protein
VEVELDQAVQVVQMVPMAVVDKVVQADLVVLLVQVEAADQVQQPVVAVQAV